VTDPIERSTMGKLGIAAKDSGFVVQDENGVVYGPQVATYKEAEELLKDWETYYKAHEILSPKERENVLY